MDIGHPAHVHLFKHVIWKLQSLGAVTCITTRDKDVAIRLLDEYGFDYEVIGKHETLSGKCISMITVTRRLLKIARKFNPHFLLASGSVHAGPVARILNRVYLSLTDTEYSVFQRSLYLPFAHRVYTPSTFRANLGRKHVTYNGFHEMTYLLPKYFARDSEVLSKYGLSYNDTYFIVRFVAWTATHDIGQRGMSSPDETIQYLRRYGTVLVSKERKTYQNSEQSEGRIAPEDMHTLLAYARMYVGEGATMASESAALGTPALYVATSRLSYIDAEVEAGLVYQIVPSRRTESEILRTIDKIMAIPIESFRRKSKVFLDSKIDVVEFLIDEILRLAKERYGGP